MTTKVFSKKLVLISIFSLFLFLNNPLKADTVDTEKTNVPTEQATKAMTVGLELLKADRFKILDCLSKDTSSNYEWIKDFFFYKGNLDCFNLSGVESKNFAELAILENLSAVKIDQDVSSTIVATREFGWHNSLQINPDFIMWIDHNFLEATKYDPEVYEKIKTIYENNKQVARVFVIAYNYLNQDMSYEDEVDAYIEAVANDVEILEYLKKYTPQQYDRDVYEYDSAEAQSGYNDNYNRFRFSVGFWLRRGTDGTNENFVQILDKVMREFDNDWYINNFLK